MTDLKRNKKRVNTITDLTFFYVNNKGITTYKFLKKNTKTG